MLIGVKLISIFLFSTLVSVFFSVPITSISYLYWLSSINIPINLEVIVDSLIHDWIYFSPVLFIVYSIGFLIAFLSSKLLLLLVSWEKKIVYGVSGACAVAAILYLSVALLFETQIIAGNRYTLGWMFHIIFGFSGGYIFASFLKKI
tara:strand:+ start:873 stop:1313 length:441 start_codon:yes stop_codon:yes gene_type:complete